MLWLILPLLGGLWKALGPVLKPLLKKWLSKDSRISTGFWQAISLRRVDLEPSALELIDKALRASLPLRVVRVHIGRLNASAGPVFGARVKAFDVHVELDWTQPEAWEDASEAVCDAAKAASQKEAKKFLKQVSKHLNPKGPVPGAVAGTVEKLLHGAVFLVKDLRLTIGSGAEIIEIKTTLRATTSGSWAIEWSGTRLKTQLRLAVNAGGKELMAPAELEAQVDLPCILKTLLVPKPMPNKKVKLEAILKHLQLSAQPASVAALMNAANSFGAFSKWKQGIAASAEELIVPLAPGERDVYLAALSKGEDVKQWESRMSCKDILQAHCEQSDWPVPSGRTLEEWFADLKRDQTPVRALEASVEVQAVGLELLSAQEIQGDGIATTIGSLAAQAKMTDLGPDSTLPPPLHANLSVSAVAVAVDPLGSLAVPLVAPCTASLELDISAEEDATSSGIRKVAKLLAQLAKQDSSEAITVTCSSRALWKLSRTLADIKAVVPPPTTGPEDKGQAQKPQETRQERLLREVQKLFRGLDADGSGFLEQGELFELVNSVYGRYMTVKELELASQQLYSALTGGDSSADLGPASQGVTLEQLQDLFDVPIGTVARQNVCLQLGEYAKPVPSGFNVLKAFKAVADLDDPDSLAGMSPELLQLRWVRTLQNYQAAKQFWAKDLAPKLDSRFKPWVLRPKVQAVDFWNDPFFSLNKFTVEDIRQELRVDFDFKVAGLSVRLADCQHSSSMPRVQVQLLDFSLRGGLDLQSDTVMPEFRSLGGRAQVKAWYWNDTTKQTEPLVEPWRMHLRADGSDISVHAYQHLVVNVTPPLLQALSVAASSLQFTVDDASDTAAAQRFASPTARRTVAWIFNHTGCDVVVSARGPQGQSEELSIPRDAWAEPQAVRLPERQVAASQRDTFHRFLSGVRLDQAEHASGEQPVSWTLSISGKDTEAWSISEPVSFSVTTRRRLFLANGRLIAVHVWVDVRSRAPVVTVSGNTTLQNMTAKSLHALKPEQSWNVDIRPFERMHLPIGGGLILSLPVASPSQQSIEVTTPFDNDEDDRRYYPLSNKGSYRFILEQHDVAIAGARKAKMRTIVCAPRVSLFNALPCEINCHARPLEEEEKEEEDQNAEDGVQDGELRRLAPECRHGFADIDPDKPIEVLVEVAGARYNLRLPADVIRSRPAVAKFQKERKKGRHKYFKLHCDDADAAHLSIDLVWQDYSAMLVVYARYWVSNKTGWELSVYSGSRLPSRTRFNRDFEYATPAALEGAAWSELSSATPGSRLGSTAAPEIALMYGGQERLQLKLKGELSGIGWAWDGGNSGLPMQHWIGMQEPGWETGWSPGVSVALAGSTGVAELPGLDPEDAKPDPQDAKPDESTDEGHSTSVAAAAAVVGHAVADLPGKLISTTDGVVVGVSVTELPAPFQRTKMVTVVPRYVLRNDLEETVEVWPSLALDRRAPGGEVPDGLPVVKPGEILAIDAVPHRRLAGTVKVGKAVAAVSVRLCSRAEGESGGWSVQLPLSAVGDSIFVLGAGTKEDPHRVIRASVQLIDATMFIVLVSGRWPYCIENRSLTHTVVFQPQAAKSGEELSSEEWVLSPCERQYFVFPDPEAPRHVHGRICGAGQGLVQQFSFQDATADNSDPCPLYIQGCSTPALQAVMRMRSSTRFLVIQDPKSVVAIASMRQRRALLPSLSQRIRTPSDNPVNRDDGPSDGRGDSREQGSTGGAGTVASKKGPWPNVDIMLAGLHVCLVDTLQPKPQELLAMTLDYVQLSASSIREIAFSIHNLQLDDFGQDSGFVLGPSNSGLNSQRDPLADTKSFQAKPLVAVQVAGPTNTQIDIFDAATRILTLGRIEVGLRPVEVLLDVPRLLGIVMRLQEWVFELRSSHSPIAVRTVLGKTLLPGFRAPQRGGETIVMIREIIAEPITLTSDICLTQRGTDDGEEDSLEVKLNSLGAGLPLPLRSLLAFLARLGASFANAAPKFKFRSLRLPAVCGNKNVVSSSVTKHYQQQLLAQSARVLGSLQVLGDPANLFDDIGSGVTTFLAKTKQEMSGEREGVGGGVQDLATGVFGGTLGSISKISGSLKDTVGSVAGRNVGTDRRAQDLPEGITMALGSLAAGMTEAVNGLVDEPMEQARDAGIVGFARGSAVGVAGLVLCPVEGVLAAVEKVAEGAEAQVRGIGKGYGGLRRPPREAFTAPEERGSGLRVLEPAFFWPEWNLRVVSVSLPCLWRERRVQALDLALGLASHKDESVICLLRREDEDGWALDGKGEDNTLAVGRVGCLRGPFRLQVFALVAGNLELASSVQLLAGEGFLPTADLASALSRPFGRGPATLVFDVLAAKPDHEEEPLTSTPLGEKIGKVVVQISPAVNPKVMPWRYIPQKLRWEVEGGDAVHEQKGGVADKLTNIGPDAIFHDG